MLNTYQQQIVNALTTSSLTEAELIREVNFLASKLGGELRPLLKTKAIGYQNGRYFLIQSQSNLLKKSQKDKTVENSNVSSQEAVLTLLAQSNNLLYPKQIRETLNLDTGLCRGTLKQLKSLKLINSRGPGHYLITAAGIKKVKETCPKIILLDVAVSRANEIEPRINSLSSYKKQPSVDEQNNTKNDDKASITAMLDDAFSHKPIENFDDKIEFLTALDKHLPASARPLAASISDDLRRFNG